MKKKIILHIGSPKCGSTYLQNVFLRNSETLRARGINYPKPVGTHPGNGRLILGASSLDLRQWFGQNTRTLIFSHEDLFSIPKLAEPFVNYAKEIDAEIQVVSFMRPFSEFIFGDYSQFMKQNFEAYLRSRNPYNGRDFNAFVHQRSQVLKPQIFLKGWERLSTLPLIVDGHRNIRKVVEELLGADAIDEWIIPRDLTNPSLRMQDCDTLVDMIGNADTSDAEIRRFFKSAFKVNVSSDSGRSSERISFIEKVFEPQTNSLRANFGLELSKTPDELQ